MKIKLILNLVNFLLVILVSVGFSQKIEIIDVQFTRTITENANKDIVKGNIYFQSQDNKVILKITEPLIQWMVIEGNAMLIYYPVEQKAFRFTSKNPLSLPFFEAFLGVMQDDFGLSTAGFKLARNEIKGDTLLTFWEPPKETTKVLGNTIIGLIKDKLVFVEIQNSRGKKIAKTTYSNHIQFGQSFFPLEIVTKKFHHVIPTTEKVTYTNPQFNIPLPYEILSFKIPADIEIKESQW